MSSKQNIKSFRKSYNYLKDPELRKKETGDSLLIVNNAEISGVSLQYLTWRNIKFVNCDFVGAYEVRPESIERAVFEGCRFAGIFNLGKLTQVQFVRCLIDGTSHLAGDTGSTDVVFDSCEMMGNDPEPNHWGSFGAYGEVTFLKCKARWASLTAETKHVIRECEFENVDCQASSDGGGSAVLVQNCKLHGLFKMVSTSLQSLTIRDTVIDNLDLSNAAIKGDVLIERVRADKLNLAVASGRAITLKSVQVNGTGSKVFYLAANRFATVLIDDCTLPSHPGDEKAWIGGAEKEPAYNAQPPLSQSVTLRASKLPELDLSYLNTRQLRIEGTSIERADMSNARIGQMELDHATFTFTLNLSGTQVKEFKQSGGTNLRKLGGLKTDGSNIKLPS